jgi:hypothetical protein
MGRAHIFASDRALTPDVFGADKHECFDGCGSRYCFCHVGLSCWPLGDGKAALSARICDRPLLRCVEVPIGQDRLQRVHARVLEQSVEAGKFALHLVGIDKRARDGHAVQEKAIPPAFGFDFQNDFRLGHIAMGAKAGFHLFRSEVNRGMAVSAAAVRCRDRHRPAQRLRQWLAEGLGSEQE